MMLQAVSLPSVFPNELGFLNYFLNLYAITLDTKRLVIEIVRASVFITDASVAVDGSGPLGPSEIAPSGVGTAAAYNERLSKSKTVASFILGTYKCVDGFWPC